MSETLVLLEEDEIKLVEETAHSAVLHDLDHSRRDLWQQIIRTIETARDGDYPGPLYRASYESMSLWTPVGYGWTREEAIQKVVSAIHKRIKDKGEKWETYHVSEDHDHTYWFEDPDNYTVEEIDVHDVIMGDEVIWV
jgi:hypothetical protein